ncbi:MAG: hypothetical protein K6F82_00270 [Sphaerochaetaceae bacterium]|nr:hypothetical protein [Sphaerochaetaceae bacterium]
MECKKIDLKKWKRKDIFDFFSSAPDPFYMVTFRQDVTELCRWAHDNKVSFYCAMIWAVSKAINSVEAFRVSIENGTPVLLEKRNPSFTDIRDGEETFYIVTAEYEDDILTFCENSKRQSLEQNFFIDLNREGDNLIYISALPWIEITALKNEKGCEGQSLRDQSVPYISWGKYTEENGRKILGLSLEVNHRFIDGIHIGQFSEKLTEIIKSL